MKASCLDRLDFRFLLLLMLPDLREQVEVLFLRLGALFSGWRGSGKVSFSHAIFRKIQHMHVGIL